MPVTLTVDPIDLIARRHRKQLVERLQDPVFLERVLDGQWPRLEDDLRDQLDRILAQLRAVPRPLSSRLADRIPGYRTLQSGSFHPQASHLGRARLAAARANLARRLEAAEDQGLIESWERDAFESDLRGLSRGQIAREAGCSRWTLDRSLLRTRRKLLNLEFEPGQAQTTLTAATT